MITKSLKVFLDEDEGIIRILVADMLGELGHTLAAEAGHIDQALELARSTEFDLAILDFNLRGEMVTPVAKLIMARGRPIIFATAFGSEGLPEDFRNFPALLKPYHLEDLAALIDQVGPRRALSP
jgi:DNA-binding response OmpR family regulator